MSDTDLELLARYTRQHAEDAFAELVRRHLGLVYSAALRQVRSPQLAEEVTQSAFIDLARSAAKLKPDTILTAWLYQVTRRTAIDVVRREASRQLREQIATEMNAMNATAADWTHIEPLLDEAMHALDDTDRAAVLLRYFENKSLREVGATLGTSENAAQKRLGRAVERLREFFAKRGVTVGASGLVGVISANAIQAAPVGLSASIVVAVAGITIGTAGTATIITMSWLNAKSAAAIMGAAVLAGTGTHLIQQQKLVQIDAAHHASLSQKTQATASRDEALATLRARDLVIAGLRKDNADLARLRNEITQLRKEKGGSLHLHPDPTPVIGAGPAVVGAIEPGKYITRELLAFAGYATPEAAVQSMVWASTSGGFDALTNSWHPTLYTAQARAGHPFDPVVERAKFETEAPTNAMLFKGMQILARKDIRTDTAEVKVMFERNPSAGPNAGQRTNVFAVIKEGNEWKWAGGPRYTSNWDENGTIEKFVP